VQQTILTKISTITHPTNYKQFKNQDGDGNACAPATNQQRERERYTHYEH
jgi:hypothetical protein